MSELTRYRFVGRHVFADGDVLVWHSDDGDVWLWLASAFYAMLTGGAS